MQLLFSEGNWEISLHGIILIYQDLDVDVAVGVYSNLTGEPASSDEAFGNRTSSPALGFDILPESRHAGEPTYHIMNIGGAGYPIIDATNFVQITIRDLLTGTPMKFKQPPYCAVIVNLTQKGIP